MVTIQGARDVTLVVVIILVIALLVYGFFLYEMYLRQGFIFAPYSPTSAPSNAFYPLGGFRELTAAEQAERRRILSRVSG